MSKPNILMMISHDTGKYLGCYGRKAKTPALDQLAQQGVRFDHYYCPAPQCSPSRGSILTGLYPHNHGLIGLAHMGFSINSDVVTLPQQLNKAGYETTLIGLSHEKMQGDDTMHALGYMNVIETPGDRAGEVALETEKFLKKQAMASPSQPFYASVSFFETHRPFDEYEADEAILIPPYLPDTAKVRQDMAGFHGSIQVLDHAVERIMRALDETGLAENTVLIYTTDHGIAFPRAKGILSDAGLETALLMRWPKGFKGGRVQGELLCNIDLMPTLLALAGAEVPSGLDGRSFLPLLKGEDYQLRDHFFCELTWHDRYQPMRGIRTQRYKYIRNFEDGPDVYLPFDIHESLSGQEVREQCYVPNVPEELYDLDKDPYEQHNVSEDRQYADILEHLRDRVNRWMNDTGDPILKGRVPGFEAPNWEEEKKKGNVYQGRNKP